MFAVLVGDVLSGTWDTTIGGTVYEDVDSNGTRSVGENGIAGWTVYLDLDHSGTLNNDAVGTLEPATVTDKDGNYILRNLQPGSYRIGEIVTPGWTPTSPVSLDVEVVLDHDTQADFFNFGGGEIVGTVWNDLDDDGTRDIDPATGAFLDPGLQGWTVFLDLNNDQQLNDSEPSTLTDTDGTYAFTGLPSGDYEVFEMLPDGWEAAKGYDNKQTAAVVPLQQTTLDFANLGAGIGTLRGTVWHDVNLDGLRNADPDTGLFTEPGLVDWQVFLDLNTDGILSPLEPVATTDASGTYTFLSLAEGDYDVTEILPDGWDVAPDFDVAQTVSVRAGRESLAADFANFSVLNGSLRGVVWNDLNRNGLRDKNLSGIFTDPGLAGWTVYLDLNGNDVADPSDPTAVTDAAGTYIFHDLQIGDYDVREILPSGWEVSPTFSDSDTVTVYSGMESVAADFANFNVAATTPGSVSGTLWNDMNGNGTRDRDPATGGYLEPGLGHWTVFLDSNSNGILESGEPQSTSTADGTYSFAGILPGTVSVGAVAMAGWRATAPRSSLRTVALKSSQELTGLDFGYEALKDSTIRGVVFADTNRDDVRAATERGLADIEVYLDLDHDGQWDASEPRTTTSADLFYTPEVDESGTYSFSHLAEGTYTVRMVLPATLSATPAAELEHLVTIAAAEDRSGVDSAAVFRANEIHGVKFEDLNGNHLRDADEPGMAGATIFLDWDRDAVLDADEPVTVTSDDGSYAFTGLRPGAYVVRDVVQPGYEQTFPVTAGDILWPAGTSHAAVGNVSPLSITAALAVGETHNQTVSLTLPTGGALTNLVDVFLLFDDTGSFVYNSPIVRAAFPEIITRLQGALPGIDLGFGVGRFEEYGNFAAEYATGRPFILNQPIVAASTLGYLTAIQSALDRTTPGYGGDQPETDIEALYQVVTGAGFDGNNNGSVLDSGVAGLAATQLHPGTSGDVPSFASFTADPANSVLPADGRIGGAGFRPGALPIILTATDTGFAYQPKGETVITGASGVTLPVSQLTETDRPTTPFNSGAGIQETVTALNALGALVIGLGTNPQPNLDPRQGLEALSRLTGAINRSTTTIENGTADSIAPGDPLYFQIASGFSASVATGVVNAIQNAVTSVAVDITVQASDPRVQITNHTGVVAGVGAGQTATFDIQFVGDGVPYRFDLQFVRAGTNVVLGSIPVTLGTPVAGSGYEFEDLEEGEIEYEDDFGDHFFSTVSPNQAPTFTAGSNQIVTEDAGPQTVLSWATDISAGPVDESWQALDFSVVSDRPDLFSVQPAVSAAGTLSYTPAENAFGTAVVSVQLHDNGGTADGGVDSSATRGFVIVIEPVNDAPTGLSDSYVTNEDTPLAISASGVLANDADPDSGLSAKWVSGPAHGTLELNADGSFIYQPAAGFYGSDGFTYVAHDGLLDSAETAVSITVVAVNDAPLVTNDSYAVDQGATLAVVASSGLLANDADADEDPLVAELVTEPMHGSVTLHEDGSFEYLPLPDFSGVDSFVYRVSDGTLFSSEATVTLDVRPSPAADRQFIVVDRFARDIFEYDAAGKQIDRRGLFRFNRSPRGVTSAPDGEVQWVVDSLGTVFVYDRAGQLIGRWVAEGVSRPEGLATNGSDLWLVDRKEREILFFAGAAAKRRGRLEPTAAFELDQANRSPMDIATDGVHLWVVDDGRNADTVFRYSLKGHLEANWTLAPSSSHPTGITIHAGDADRVWVVDAGTDRVYQYDGGESWLSGNLDATASFALGSGNREPQGIVSKSLFPAVAATLDEVVPSGGVLPHAGGHEEHKHASYSRVPTSEAAKAPPMLRDERSSRSVGGRDEHAGDAPERTRSIGRDHDAALEELVEELKDHLSEKSLESLFGKRHRD